jgi:hypothetical protein
MGNTIVQSPTSYHPDLVLRAFGVFRLGESDFGAGELSTGDAHYMSENFKVGDHVGWNSEARPAM